MSPSGAYEDEMPDLEGLSDHDLDRLMAGLPAVEAEGTEELATLLRDLRVAYSEAPSRWTEAAHVATAVEAGAGAAGCTAAATALVAEPSGRPVTRSTRRLRMFRTRPALAIAAVVVAAPLATAGLAVAGVSLPDVARAPFDEVGVTLPNQSRADDVHAVIDATAPGDRGCTFGQQVAAAATAGKTHPAEDPCTRGEGGGPTGEDRGEEAKAATEGSGGNSGVDPSAGQAFGEATAADAQANASADGQAFGQGTSQSAQQLAPDHPSVPPVPPVVDPQGGPETGESASATGSSTAANTPAGDHIP